MRLPHPWIRRLLLWPIPVIAALLYLATVPLLVLGALLLSYRLPGKLRVLRALGIASVYLFVEAAVMLAGLVLWIASGFGWRTRRGVFLTAHYAVLRWALKVLVAAGLRLCSVEIEADGPPQVGEPAALDPTGPPVIVMSRHAGPADSILLLNGVMSGQGRRPRIVAKDLLQWDPAFDLLLNRLPNRFISTGGGHAAVDAISDLATGMDGRDAFVIFPEGGNFTEARRLRAIDRLRRGGDEVAAVRPRSPPPNVPTNASDRARSPGIPEADSGGFSTCP
mgnify:CR=1 FL=1